MSALWSSALVYQLRFILHTYLQQTADNIVYSNIVTYYESRPVNGSNQVITREHPLHISVECNIGREQVLQESYLPITGEVTINEVKTHLTTHEMFPMLRI